MRSNPMEKNGKVPRFVWETKKKQEKINTCCSSTALFSNSKHLRESCDHKFIPRKHWKYFKKSWGSLNNPGNWKNCDLNFNYK